MSEHPRYMNVTRTAAYLGISRESVYTHIRAKSFPVLDISPTGGRASYVIAKDELDKFLASRVMDDPHPRRTRNRKDRPNRKSFYAADSK